MQNASTDQMTLSSLVCGVAVLRPKRPRANGPLGLLGDAFCMHLTPPSHWLIMPLQALREKRNARGPLGCYSPPLHKGLCG